MIALVEPIAGRAPTLMRTRFAPLPETGQGALLAQDDGVDVLVGGMGSGKSLPAAIKLLSWTQRRPLRSNGIPSDWYCIGPTLRNVVEQMFKKLLEAERYFPIPLIEKVLPGLGNPRILLRNGVTIYGRSGTNPRDYKGDEVEGFWMDEASEQSLLAFAMALSRERGTDRLRAVITTNPQLGWIWDLVRGAAPTATGDEHADRILQAYAKVREKLRITIHRWAAAKNTTTTSEVLDGISGMLDVASPDLGAQEIGGLFRGTEIASQFFPWLGRAFGGEHRLAPGSDRAVAIGVDLGQSVDFTWFGAMNRDGVLLASDRFNASTVVVKRDEFYPFVERRLIDFAQRWRGGQRVTIKLDEAMHGKAFAQALRVRLAGLGLRDAIAVEGYRTDQPSRKADAIEALDVAGGRGQIRVPETIVLPNDQRVPVEHVEQLKRELSELVVEPMGDRVRYDHPQGGHDDGVVMLALAWQGVSQRPACAVPRNLNRWMDQPGLRS